MHRDGLRTALGGRDDVSLEPVLRLLIKHIADPRFGNMCYDISGIVIGGRSINSYLAWGYLRPSYRHVHVRPWSLTTY